MTLSVSFEEQLDSRSVDISNDNFEQKFTFHLCGNFTDEAGVDIVYGPDDDLEVLKSAYTIIPPWRRVPVYDGSEMILVLTNMSVNMLFNDHWTVEVTYGAPDFGGSGANGYSASAGAIGPNVGDKETWTNRFVQVSVNMTATTENKKLSLKTLTCQKAVNSPNQTVPYPSGKPAPIGWSMDEVTGSEVYVRSFEFSLTAYFRPYEYSFAYVRRLYRMMTTLNSKTFVGFPAGSVLFLGHNASGDIYNLIPVTFDFLMKPNFKLLQAGPTKLMAYDVDDVDKMYDQYYEPYFPDATGIRPGNAISGHSEIDYSYLRAPDNDSKMALQKPILRTIHMNYEDSDFDGLQL